MYFQQICLRLGNVGAVLAATLVVGCGQQQAPQAPVTPPPAAPASQPEVQPEAQPRPAEKPRSDATIALTEADGDRAVTLHRGQVVEIRLQADRGAGYHWIPAANLLPTMSTDGLPTYEDDASGRAPGTEVWRFVGREAGHAHLVFEYRSPTEPNAPPQQTITYHFDVK